MDETENGKVLVKMEKKLSKTDANFFSTDSNLLNLVITFILICETSVLAFYAVRFHYWYLFFLLMIRLSI